MTEKVEGRMEHSLCLKCWSDEVYRLSPVEAHCKACGCRMKFEITAEVVPLREYFPFLSSEDANG